MARHHGPGQDHDVRGARSATIRANRTAELNGLLGGATNADIRGAGYAGLMAITECLDHPNGKDADVSALRVATSAGVQATKDKALTKILALVTHGAQILDVAHARRLLAKPRPMRHVLGGSAPRAAGLADGPDGQRVR